MSEYRFKISDFTPMWPVNPEFLIEGVVPTNQSSFQKTRLDELSCGIKIWTDLSSVSSQCTCLTDTDGQNFHR